MAFLAILLSVATGERTRRGVFDTWQRLSPRDLSDTDVRVVLIDSESLSSIGPWPWPRYYMARLTEEIAAAGASVIGFDILFPEPDSVRPDMFVKLYPELSTGAAAEVEALEPMDRLFGKVIGMAPVVLARAGAESGTSDAGGPPVDVQFDGRLPPSIESWPAAISAIPELDDVALGHGLVNAQPDSDGVIRSVPLIMRVANQTMPGFALEVARVRLDARAIRLTASSIELAGRRIPVDKRGRMLLHFGTFPDAKIVSAEDVLGRAVGGGTFARKIVIIGLSAEGTSDIVTTSNAAEGFGVLVQAQATDAILRGGWLARPNWVEPLEWAAAIVLAMLALVAAFGGLARRAVLAITYVAVPVASWFAFEGMALLIDPVRPLVIGSGAIAGVIIGLFADARHERERLREVLVQERILAAEAEGELQAARAIQMSMVPPRASLAKVDPRIDVDALLEPARSVGGDFYDFAKISPDLVGFVIGDVTGKGVPAALFMAMSKALTRSALSRDAADIERVAANINTELILDNNEAMSVTMLLGVLDLTNGSVRLVCAGHEDPILVTTDHIATRHPLSGGPPFSIVEFNYPVETLTLRSGEALLLVTDGITEAQNASGALYGRDRIFTDVSFTHGHATDICETIRDDVRQFEEGTEATDDLTIMVLRYLGPTAAA